MADTVEVVFSPSRCGLPTCMAAGKNLHSTRDPLAEARRFLETRRDRGPALDRGSQVLLIGPCLDYLSECLAESFRGIEIVSLQLSADFRGLERPGAALRWYPDSTIPLDSFLLEAIDADALASLAIVEWPPGLEAFPREAKEARAALARTLSRNASEAATTRAAGRRWIANSVKNFLDIRSMVSLDFGNRPMAILGAGPTLPSALAILLPYWKSFGIVAVSSAVAAIVQRGFEPDLVVGTDPGWWSLPHLRPLVGRSIPLASPLSACAGWHGSPSVVIDQGWTFETQLAGELGPSLRLPSHGTVSGSALAAAAMLSAGHLVIAGFDFAAKASETHARPHAFDTYILSRESRVLPGESLRWSRAVESHPEAPGELGWRTSRPLRIYAEAIAGDIVNLGGRVSRIAASPIALPARPADASDLAGMARASPAGRCEPRLLPVPTSARRKERLEFFLTEWKGSAAEYLGGRLGEPGSDSPIVDILRCVDLPDWAAVRRAARSGRDATESKERLLREVRDFLSALERKWLG